LENTTRNFYGELCDGRFDVTPGRGEFARNALFRFGDLGGCFGARVFQ
jgi:hypothetical protein